MAVSDSRKADRIYRAVLDRPAPERDAYITASCDGDEGLEALVRRLLEQTDVDDSRILPGGGLRLFGVETGDFARRDIPALATGARIGRYRIERTLGRGGMATVYLAERADGQFEQQVALKVLDRSGESVARFEQECQILAALNHPNIARMFDAGVTDEGISWVAMEYLEGQSLFEYCEQQRLGIDERLILFVPIVEAVHEAHRHLVVHRDIKSSNIVVGPDRVPKLLDFGIAKLLAPDAMPRAAPETRVGVPLTPEYASPEQIRNESITVASDIYQLGYLLYGLLTGTSPYRIDPADMPALVNAIAQAEPVAPSACFDGENARERAAARAASPASLRTRLAGDLDQVTLKALRKEPSRRYESAARLAGDIENVLAMRPVSAHPDSAFYRAGKFFRRHRAGTIATGVAVVAAIAAATAFTVRLAQEKARAEGEAARASEVSAFLVDLVELSEAERKASRQITVREVLDRAAERTATELGTQPRLRASLQSVIGQMYRELGTYDESERLLDASLATLQGATDDADDELADVRVQRAKLYLYQGRYEEALEEADLALALMAGSDSTDATLLATAMTAKGRAERLLGNLDAAQETLHDARRQRLAAGPDPRSLAAIELELGNVEYDASRFDMAREYFQRTIDTLEPGVAGAGLDLARAYMRLGMLEVELNDLEAAERLANAALATVERVHGADHPDRSFPLGLLSSIEADRGDFDAAEAKLRELLRNNEAVYGPEHPETATILNNLGTLRFRQARFEEAAAFYRRAVDVRSAALGPEHPITAMTVSFEAYALHLAGDPGAEARYKAALVLLEAAYEPGHRYIANMQHDLGRLYVEQGRYELAEPYLRDALATRIDVFGDGNLRSKATMLYLGACLAGQGRLDAAGELLSDVREWAISEHGADSEQAVHANIWVADWLRRSRRADEGRQLIAEALAVIEPKYDEDYWLMRSARAIEAKF